MNISPYSYPGIRIPHKRIVSHTSQLDIIKKVLHKHYKISFDEANIKSRIRELSEWRQHFMYLTRKYTPLSLKAIGSIFTFSDRGYMDHSTVIWAIKTQEDRMFTEPKLQALNLVIEKELERILR